MLTQNEPLPEDDRSETERHITALEREVRSLKERHTMRNAAAVLYATNLERLLEAVEADAVTPRVIAQARKALGWSYDADDLGEYGQDGAF